MEKAKKSDKTWIQTIKDKVFVNDVLVNNQYFREVAVNGIPKMNPYSREYKEWWAEQHKRCIHGYTVGGKTIPGRLYFHLNFWNIERNDGKSNRKSLGLPDLRDIDLEIFPILEDSKGFSGYDENGIPQYHNQAKGFCMVGSRDFGKSVIGSSNVGYEYTFFKNNEIIVSAYETKYTNPLLDKVRTGLDNLPGEIDLGDEYFPPPFAHNRIKDDWSREIRSGRKITVNGNKKTVGFNSRILHKVFKDNPMACNGLRTSWHVFEEIGAFNNLLESYNASRPCWNRGGQQFGTPYLIGTGGDMDRGTIDAQKMFFKPEAFNLIGFDDLYEPGNKNKICYFVPADIALDDSRNEIGIVDRVKNKKLLKERRESKKGDRISYENEIQYYPLEPKEAFLVTKGNLFPTDLIQDQITYLLSSKATEFMGQKGSLSFDKGGKVVFSPNDRLHEVDYPHHESTKTAGCVTIYEHPQPDPNGEIPFGLYIGGCDPIDMDSAYTTNSLGSVFIYKRFWSPDRTYDTVVAEYTGRPDRSVDFYEGVRKLAMYYGNCKILYENMLKGLYQHFEHKKCLHLLKEQPSILKDIIPNGKVNRGFGTHMSKEIKAYCMGLIRDWLLEEYDEGRFNTSKIYSINLLKEMLYYNDTGNFDRIIAFALCILHNKEIHRVRVEKHEDQEKRKFFQDWFDKDGW
jgi:hypothetical protein